ncbi:MAG: ABC-ATPase domain-containing protein [Lachnospiraceae bacterium]|jgi:predicted ABC-class ATPase|nr:ABC-ATPase domain-containing protein [Lachnospiraceae bacterium]MCI9682440.1 ABC-ATPase domain-containing protein [Lachnospiraceae bacterium]
MKSSQDLRANLRSIDHRSYPAYKDLRGQYDFGSFVLSIDHVQGDPFASPSRLSVLVSGKKAGFPAEYYDTYPKRITLQDHLTRLFAAQLSSGSKQAKGSGKSGLLGASRCGQEVLERTACRVREGNVTLRFEAGFPARGRTIDARELEKMLFDILPDCVHASLYFQKINKNRLKAAIELCEDQQYIREQLPALGLCAFLANGSILPRQSGVSDRPMQEAVAFQSPASMEVTLDLPNRGPVTGMGIPKGISLFVGGGYHGKSTVLQALQYGVYNHIGGDGRELVITDESAWKLRSEDGRSVTGVDISPFIRQLPGRRDTRHFSTEDASGSTSQAANLMESMESGSTLLLIDEDTSATNFMIRDKLMQQVVAPEEEPIIPFIERVRSLYEDFGISSVIVAGSSGSYFHVADTVVQMKEYVPYDITGRAKEAAAAFPVFSTKQDKFPAYSANRCPRANAAVKRDDRLKLKAMGTHELLLGRDAVELRYLEQLRDGEQTMALAYLLKFLQLQVMDGKKNMPTLADQLEALLNNQGLEGLFEHGDVRSSLARPRRQEILACVNRYRQLLV